MNRARCIDPNDPMMNNNQYMNDGNGMMNNSCQPIYEPMVEKCCHREFVHEVPHLMPCHTRIINHHIYRHTYTPCYSCSEENEVCNVYDNKCC